MRYGTAWFVIQRRAELSAVNGCTTFFKVCIPKLLAIFRVCRWIWCDEEHTLGYINDIPAIFACFWFVYTFVHTTGVFRIACTLLNVWHHIHVDCCRPVMLTLLSVYEHGTISFDTCTITISIQETIMSKDTFDWIYILSLLEWELLFEKWLELFQSELILLLWVLSWPFRAILV